MLDDVVVDLAREVVHFARGVEPCELLHELGVFRRSAAHGFEGKCGAVGEFEFEADVEE